MKYNVEKYCGRVYCGNGLFNTLDECFNFGNDGFCDKIIVFNLALGGSNTYKLNKEGLWACIAKHNRKGVQL